MKITEIRLHMGRTDPIGNPKNFTANCLLSIDEEPISGFKELYEFVDRCLKYDGGYPEPDLKAENLSVSEEKAEAKVEEPKKEKKLSKAKSKPKEKKKKEVEPILYDRENKEHKKEVASMFSEATKTTIANLTLEQKGAIRRASHEIAESSIPFLDPNDGTVLKGFRDEFLKIYNTALEELPDLGGE